MIVNIIIVSIIIITSLSIHRGDPQLVAAEIREKEYDIGRKIQVDEKKKQDDEWDRAFKLKQLESQERLELARIESQERIEKMRAQQQESFNKEREQMMEALLIMLNQASGGGGK